MSNQTPLPDLVVELLNSFREILECGRSTSQYSPLLLTRVEDVLSQERHKRRGDRALALVLEAIYKFPQAGEDEEINGADAVDWLVDWISRAKKELK